MPDIVLDKGKMAVSHTIKNFYPYMGSLSV